MIRLLADVLDAAKELARGELKYRREHPQEFLEDLLGRYVRRRARGARGARFVKNRAKRWADRFGLDIKATLAAVEAAHGMR